MVNVIFLFFQNNFYSQIINEHDFLVMIGSALFFSLNILNKQCLYNNLIITLNITHG